MLSNKNKQLDERTPGGQLQALLHDHPSISTLSIELQREHNAWRERFSAPPLKTGDSQTTKDAAGSEDARLGKMIAAHLTNHYLEPEVSISSFNK